MKRIISLLLVICLMFSFCVTGASASEIAGNAEATVRYIDENGDIHSSDKSIDFFLNMSDELPNTRMIPTVDDNSIRITDVVTRTVTKEQISNTIGDAVGIIFNYAWGKHSGKLFDVITKGKISSNSWFGAILSTQISKAISSGLDHLNYSPAAAKLYQYKTWSNYYNQYLVYQVVIFYYDSSCTSVEGVDYWEVYRENGNNIAIQ